MKISMFKMWQDIPSFQILWSKEITNKSTWEIEYNVRIAVRHEMGIWNRICFFSIWSHSLLRLGSWDSIMGRFVTCFLSLSLCICWRNQYDIIPRLCNRSWPTWSRPFCFPLWILFGKGCSGPDVEFAKSLQKQDS